MNRQQLPYRPVVNAILVMDGKIVAYKHPLYIKFPGGGVDKGETPYQALKRELMEELGVKVSRLKCVSDLYIQWNEQWVNNESKKKERYKQYRGEHVFLFVGVVDSLGVPTSKEGDAWINVKKTCRHKPQDLVSVIKKGLSNPQRNTNFDALYYVQLAILNLLKLCTKQ